MKIYGITLILLDTSVAFSTGGIFSFRRTSSSVWMANDTTNEKEPRTNLQSRVDELADRRAKIQLEINAEEEKTKELRIKFETLKKELELEAKKKAEEEAAKAEEEAIAKTKAEEEAIAKTKAGEEALAEKKRVEGETQKRVMNETVKTNDETSNKVVPGLPAIIPKDMNKQVNPTMPFNVDTLKSLSSSNQVRIVTGLATSFSALVFLRSFLTDRPEKQDENSKSAIVQAMERAGLGERVQKKNKPYTKVLTTQKIDITAAEQMAAKPKAGAGKAKAKAPTKAKAPVKAPVKPKSRPVTNEVSQSSEKASVEAPETLKQEPSQQERRSEPSQTLDTKTEDSIPVKKKADTTQMLNIEKDAKTPTDNVSESTPVPQTNDQESSPSTATKISSEDDTQRILPNKSSESKPSRPFLGGSSSYLDSL